MANYSTNLKSWGSTGQEYPSGYQYNVGEQPVDAWDNFTNYNIITDITHLTSLTNARLESGAQTSYPGTPEDGELSWRTDMSRLSIYDDGNSTWKEIAYKSEVEDVQTWIDDHSDATGGTHGVPVGESIASVEDIDIAQTWVSDHSGKTNDVHGIAVGDAVAAQSSVNDVQNELDAHNHDGEDIAPGSVTTTAVNVSEAINLEPFNSLADVPSRLEVEGNLVYTKDEGLVVFEA